MDGAPEVSVVGVGASDWVDGGVAEWDNLEDEERFEVDGRLGRIRLNPKLAKRVVLSVPSFSDVG